MVKKICFFIFAKAWDWKTCTLFRFQRFVWRMPWIERMMCDQLKGCKHFNTLVHKQQQECCRLLSKQSQHLRGNDPWSDQHGTLTHKKSRRLNIIIFMATTTTTTATTFIITFAIRDWPARVAGDGPIVLHFCRWTSTNTTDLGNQRNEKV